MVRIMAISEMVEQAVNNITMPYQVTSVALGPSKIATYLKCGLAYKFQYIDKVRKPASPAMVLGSSVHEVIRMAHNNKWKPNHAVDAASALEKLWEEVRGTTTDPDDIEANLGKEEAAKVWLPWYLDWISEQRDIAVEERWELDYDGIKMQGTIDRVYRHNGQTVISDVKTGKRAPTAADLMNDPQLSIYSWAWRELAGVAEDNLEIVQIRSRTPHRTIRSDKYLDDYMQLSVVPVAKQIAAGYFPANPSPKYGCSFCTYQENCPLGQGGL